MRSCPLKQLCALTAILLAACTVAYPQVGQLFKKAPEGVEEALRARVDQFFSLQQQGKFRAAEGCVCDDTKDYFYDLKKKSPRSYEIDKLEFSEDFKTATALVSIGADIPTMTGMMQVVAPMATTWRLENGQWCFYATRKQQTTMKTPFGEVTQETAGASAKPRNPRSAVFRPVSPADVQNSVGTSAQAVVFEAGKAAAAEIEFTNSLPGRVQIATEGLLPPGIEVKIAPKELGHRESAKARFEYTPTTRPPAEEYLVRFLVEPTRQQFAIKVRFELPPSQSRPQPNRPATPAVPPPGFPAKK